MFDIPAQDSQVHGPAITGYPVVVVVRLPADVAKPHLRGVGGVREIESNARVFPIRIGSRDLQLEGPVREHLGHPRAPIDSRAKSKLVFGSDVWRTRRCLRPP